MYISKVKKCVSKILLNDIPNFLGQGLRILLEWELHSKKYPYSREGKLFDLLRVQGSSRFAGLDGIIYHNCLGISYLMTKHGLAIKLTQDTGVEHTVEQAQDLIDKFYEAYSTFNEWQQDDIQSYYDGNPMTLKDGWTMWPDNINHRSAANSRLQGAGAVIMRSADFYAYEEGLYVPFTLHDALFIEFDLDDLGAIDKLANCMRKAFVDYFPKNLHHYAEKIKLDITVWSEEYEEGKVVETPEGRKVKLQKKYVDKRSVEYYEKYKYYLEHDIYEF